MRPLSLMAPFFRYRTTDPVEGVFNVAIRAWWGWIKASSEKFLKLAVSPFLTLAFDEQDVADDFGKELGDAIVDNFSAQAPKGHVHSQANNISETLIPAPNGYYFGRSNGLEFNHYAINQGIPPRIAEWIGGFQQVVDNWIIQNAETTSNLHGYWGLAPMLPSDPVWTGAIRAELESALEALSAYDNANNPQMIDLTGVIITVFQSATPAATAGIMAAANVKQAVQIDGSDSVLLAVEKQLVVGDRMPANKQKGQYLGLSICTEISVFR